MSEHSIAIAVQDCLSRVSGEVGVWLGDLDGRVRFALRPDEPHRAASMMKLPLAVAVLELVQAGAIELSQPVPVHNDFSSVVPGRLFEVVLEDEDYTATGDRLGDSATVEWLLGQMVSVSSNLATNLLIELAGVAAANRVLRRSGGKSVIGRGLYDQPAIDLGIGNLMTPADFAAVLIELKNARRLGAEYSRLLLDLLAANVWTDEIPAGLPAGTRVEHKNGWLPSARHDGGIVYPDDADPFVLVVFSSGLPDADAGQLIAQVASTAWSARHDLV